MMFIYTQGNFGKKLRRPGHIFIHPHINMGATLRCGMFNALATGCWWNLKSYETIGGIRAAQCLELMSLTHKFKLDQRKRQREWSSKRNWRSWM